MASNSKSTTLTSGAGGTFILSTSFNENSTSIANNTSNITISGTLARGTGRFQSGQNNMLRVYWHDNKNNTDVLVAEQVVHNLYDPGASATASGTINVDHKSDGNLSGYSFATWTKVTTTNAAPASTSVSTDWTALTSIARKAELTNTYDFNDDENPIFYFNNPGSFWLRFALEWNNQTESIVRDIESAPSSPYTLVLTDAERDRLRKACEGDSMPIRMVIATSIAGTYSQWSWQDKTFYRKRRINVFPQANVRKLGDPYVYTGGSYKRGIPYVYKNGAWKMGTS